MTVLYITITDASGRFESFCVEASPMRLGRSPLNDMVIDFPFVSQFHGVVRFSDESVTYIDLGSRNATRVDGQVVTANRPVTLLVSSEVEIGPLRLTFATGQTTGVSETWPYFGPSSEPPSEEDAEEPNETVFLPSEHGTDSARKWAPAKHLPPEVCAPPPRPSEPPPEPRPMPPPTSMPAPALMPPMPPTPAGNLADRLSALLDRPENRGDEDLILGLAEIAEVAARSALALRAGDESVGDELGIRTVHQAGRPARHATAKEMLDYLLFGEGRRSSRIRELSTTFGDAAIHQVALLNAIRKGVQSLVEYLHPASGGFAERNGSRGGLFGLAEYTAFFDEQMREPWSKILGSSFANAYAVSTDARTTGRQVSPVATDPEPFAASSETAFFQSAPPAVAPQLPPTQGAVRPRLVVTSPELNGTEFVLASDQMTLGRTEDNLICLPLKSVSSRHAVLTLESGVWTITDQHSTNGVLVNGRRWPRASLSHGDVIQVGRVQLRFMSDRGPGPGGLGDATRF